MQSRVDCDFTTCDATFAREAERARHEKEVHGELKRCPVEECTWGGTKRMDRVKNHLKTKHPDIYNVFLNVPQDFGLAPGSTGSATQGDNRVFEQVSDYAVYLSGGSYLSTPVSPSAVANAASQPASTQYFPRGGNEFENTVAASYSANNASMMPQSDEWQSNNQGGHYAQNQGYLQTDNSGNFGDYGGDSSGTGDGRGWATGNQQ